MEKKRQYYGSVLIIKNSRPSDAIGFPTIAVTPARTSASSSDGTVTINRNYLRYFELKVRKDSNNKEELYWEASDEMLINDMYDN